MSAPVSRGIVGALVALAAVAGLVRQANAQAMVEYSAETRFQLDLHVPDAAVKASLPPGWTLNVAPQGPAKAVLVPAPVHTQGP